LAATLCTLLAAVAACQQTDADKPATKEDVEKYFQVMHSPEMMTEMIDAMTKPMHQMLHEQYMRDKDQASSGF